MKKSIIGVLGIGEVGSAISSILEKKYLVLKKDVKFDEIKRTRLDVLHVCIPYSKNFEKVAVRQIRLNNPSLTIIHSTVMPKTTENIYGNTNKNIVHSPVMGKHPKLKRDILNFTKVIGPVNKHSKELARKHFNTIGIKTFEFNSSLESEVAKLLDTTYYAWNIIFNKMAFKICKNMKINFDNVYKKFNQIYNESYKESKPAVVRPILEFKDGPIGGHCVIPNTIFLNKFYKSPITKLILSLDKEFGKKSKKAKNYLRYL